jgi:hypothetical protein
MRTDRIEQILPTLATKQDLERFATKEDLERFATKEDLARFAAEANARFATKQDLTGMHDDLRRYMLMLYESLRDDIRLLAEHVAKKG